MPKSEATTSDLKGIGNVIRDARLRVPKHQRPFEWTDVQVNELLEDVGNAFSEEQNEYFLGSIVAILPPKADWHEVLDGQQRLASISMFFAAASAEFTVRNEAARAADVSLNLSSFDMKSGKYLPRLRLSTQDDAYFQELLSPNYKPPDENAPESHKRLYLVRTVASDWLKARLALEKKPVDWLVNWTQFLREAVYVVYFVVPDDANAYLIFETLNDRGLELSIADLLKNYLLGRAGAEIDHVLETWKSVISTLKANKQEHVFTVFLRHLWSSKYEVAREKELYRQIKKRIRSQADVLGFTKLLEGESNFYSAILSPTHEYWTTKQAQMLMSVLDELTLEQYRPLLLAALGVFEKSITDVENLLRRLINWNVRLLVVGGGGGGVMERNYSDLARKIRAGNLKTVAEVTKSAKVFVPTDAEFEKAFAVARVANASLARYYLRVLERVASGDAQPELTANEDPGQLNLEHVLPEKPENNWPTFTEEDRKGYTKRLGNMVLLPQKLNSKLKSAAFADKKAQLKTSKLTLTKEVAKQSKWSGDEIRVRQLRLARLAVKAWPR